MTDGFANRIYCGHVMHMRLAPKRHRFRYRVFSLLVDIDRMDRLDRGILLRHNSRCALMSVMDRDHGARDGMPLRPWVDAKLAAAGIRPCPKVMMLSFPRMLGYGFNPLSVYFCHDAGGALAAVIYEVKNTFGDQVAYTLRAGAAEGGCHRHSQKKSMYVSPFIDMDQTYQFALQPPGARLSLKIRQAGPGGDAMIATHCARARPLTGFNLARAFVIHPLLSFRVIALIHWQALRLALKGLKFHRYSHYAAAIRRLATSR